MKGFIGVMVFLSVVTAIGCTVVSSELTTRENMTTTEEFSAPATPTNDARTPVLVELFTSEGCSSCPPADRVLASLPRDAGVKDANVITLGFHVDYWDYLGWKDRFSSAAFSQRQGGYSRQFKQDSNYTPQMVVDGSVHFVGSNRPNAIDAISKALTQPKPAVDLSLAEGTLGISLTKLPSHKGATVYLAVAEDGLTTKVGRGENSGSTLPHASVVRDLSEAGKVAASETSFRTSKVVPMNKDWKTDNLKYVVIVQDDATLRVLAVNQLER